MADSTELCLSFYPAGTDPLDVAIELNREFGFEMLVYTTERRSIVELWTDDCWSYAIYVGDLWPERHGSEFPKHWRFAILPHSLE